ncbi:hypothetical protein J6590_062733 [Homalodisca vitripennis]|nr:hypothetical protein J6590_062733 [Homalodisca vitripennis]
MSSIEDRNVGTTIPSSWRLLRKPPLGGDRGYAYADCMHAFSGQAPAYFSSTHTNPPLSSWDQELFNTRGLQCSGCDSDDNDSLYCSPLQLLPVLQSSQVRLKIHSWIQEQECTVAVRSMTETTATGCLDPDFLCCVIILPSYFSFQWRWMLVLAVSYFLSST